MALAILMKRPEKGGRKDEKYKINPRGILVMMKKIKLNFEMLLFLVMLLLLLLLLVMMMLMIKTMIMLRLLLVLLLLLLILMIIKKRTKLRRINYKNNYHINIFNRVKKSKFMYNFLMNIVDKELN